MRRIAARPVSFRAALGLLAAVTIPAAPAVAQQDAGAPRAGGDSIAIYQNDLALVTTRRSVELSEGTASLGIDGISPSIVPGSLDVSGPGLSVLEQSLAPWPLDRRALLQAFLGREVTLVRPAQGEAAPVTDTATLLSIENGLVLRIGDKVEVDPEGRIVFPELPAELSASPRANVRVRVADAGRRTLELRYLTQGLSWEADYVARYDEDAGTLDLTGLARLTNGLPVAIGADRVRLVAGQVSMPKSNGPRPAMALRAMAQESDQAGVPAPESVSDLKVYDLDRRVDVPAGGAVQLPLLHADDVAVEREYRVLGLATAYPYNGERGPSAANVRLRLPDTAEAGLDQPLPAGEMRVYAETLYRGAERIPDTPVGAELTVDLGRAFDVTATARQTAFEQLGERAYETAQTIVVKNAKSAPVSVQVLGDFPADWEVRAESHPHDRRDATTPVWTLEVPAGGETELSYRVRVRR